MNVFINASVSVYIWIPVHLLTCWYVYIVFYSLSMKHYVLFFKLSILFNNISYILSIWT